MSGGWMCVCRWIAAAGKGDVGLCGGVESLVV